MSDFPYQATVIIPTLNEGDRLARVLRAVSIQKAPFPFEILVLDAGSSDGSVTGLEQRVDFPPLRILSLPPGSFGHGRSRLMGAQASRSPYVIYLVADAVPATATWLTALVAALEDFPEAVAGSARQLPWPHADPALVRRLSAWTPEGDQPEPLRHPLHPGMRLEEALLSRCVLDNVCAIYRREYLLAHPFADVPFGEDLLFARDQLLMGQTLLYIPTAAVWHSHRRSFWDHVGRARLEHQMLSEALSVRRVPSSLILLLQSLALLKRVREDSLEGTTRQLGELWGQYLGGRSRTKSELAKSDPTRPRQAEASRRHRAKAAESS